jgi:hypothetical protein
VDEDLNRRGVRFMGRSIVTPEDVAPGSRVFIPLGGDLAAIVAARMAVRFPDVEWIASPPLTAA